MRTENLAISLSGASRKRNLTFSSFLTALLSIVISVLLSNTGFAQIIGGQDPHVACTNGCTSKDVQIQRAYLVDLTAAHNELGGSFVCNGSAEVQLALDLTTKTPRVGVFVYANIRQTDQNGNVLDNVSECFTGKALSSTGVTKVVFSKHLTWTCGTTIVLTDVFIGWGTGNTDFCAGLSDPRCPATPSKCYSLPAGTYIPIVTPTPSSTHDEKCAEQTGCTSSFNLTSYETTIKNGQNVDITWFSNAGLTTAVPDPTSFSVTNSATAYAKVANHDHPEVYSTATLMLTVYCKPAPPVLSKVDNCNGTTTITAKDGNGNNIPAGELTWSNGATGNPINVSNTTSVTATRTIGNCTSGNSNAVTPAPGSAPNAPAVTYNAPACDATTFSVTITNVANGVTYTIKDKNGANIPNVSPGNSVTAQNTSNITFSNIPAGSGYQVTASSGSCSSTATSCGTPSQQQARITEQTAVNLGQNQIGVKTYPNPFNNKVKFEINSPEAGNGSLEVYNTLGQKVKTIYQGHINAGSQTFELSLPTKLRSMLVYIFRVGDKQVTGKLIQTDN
jgi:hypothetical protein